MELFKKNIVERLSGIDSELVAASKLPTRVLAHLVDPDGHTPTTIAGTGADSRAF